MMIGKSFPSSGLLVESFMQNWSLRKLSPNPRPRPPRHDKGHPFVSVETGQLLGLHALVHILAHTDERLTLITKDSGFNGRDQTRCVARYSLANAFLAFTSSSD